MSDPDVPTRARLRLRPKVPPVKFRRGMPWVYADEAVLDRRTRTLAPGTIVTLEDTERQGIATAAINPNSKIVGRILDLDPDAEITADWLAGRFRSALNYRETLYPTPHYRLVNAEADGLPGVIIDRFGEAVVVQPNAAWAETHIEAITSALASLPGITTIHKNATSRSRTLEGLDDQSVTLMGTLDGPIPVPMNGATYLADLLGGQKTGLFYDQRENHAFAARLAEGRDVLDVFAHVGGFGLAALAGGATSVLAVDASEPALALAAEGATAMGATAYETRKADALTALRQLQEEARTFGLVICDPPAFAPHKDALQKGLRGYENVAQAGARVTGAGGFLVLCSCSQAAGLADFRASSLIGISKAGRRAQLIHTGGAGPDHPLHPRLADAQYLKALFFRLDP